MRRLLTPKNLLLLVLLAVMFWSFYSGASPSHGTPPASADKAATTQGGGAAAAAQASDGAPEQPVGLPLAYLQKLKDVADKPASTYIKPGRPTLVKFWASWCPLCLSELADTNAWATDERFSSAVNLVTLASPGFLHEKPQADFVTWYGGLDYPAMPVLLDAGGLLARQLGVRVYPSWVLLDADGGVARVVRGRLSEAQALALIEDPEADLARLAQAERAIVGRLDLGLVEPRLGQRLTGTCGLELALRLVSRLGVAGATLKQHLRTLVVFLGEVEVGPSLGELGTGNGVVETDQQIAGSHRLAFTKMQGGQAPFHFRANHHRLVGTQRTEGDQLVAHLHLPHRHHLDHWAFGSHRRQRVKAQQQPRKRTQQPGHDQPLLLGRSGV